MAYVLKYKVEIKCFPKGLNEGLNDAATRDAVFEIEELDPANSTVNSFVSEEAPILDQIPDRENKDFNFITTKCIVNIKNYKLVNFLTEDERKFRGTLKIDGVVKFKGWLLTDVSTTDEVFNANISDLRLTFSDGINTLDETPYTDATTGNKLFGKASIIEILTNINKITGLGLDLVSFADFSSSAITGARPLEQQKISQLRFFNSDKTPYSCKKVIETLCNLHFAKFYQRDGAFWFVPFSQFRKTNRTFNKYNNSGVYQSDFSHNGFKTVGDSEDVYLGTGTATRNYLAPYKRCSLSTVFENGYLFENEALEYYTAGASEPITANLRGVESQVNNVTIPNWPNTGAVKISMLTYSQTYMSELKSLWNLTDANTRFGAFLNNDKVFVIQKSGSLDGAVLTSSDALIKKGTSINFTEASHHNLYVVSPLAGNAGQPFWFVRLKTKEGAVYFMNSDGKWRLDSASMPNTTVTKYIQATRHNAVGNNKSITINYSNITSELTPVDGVLNIILQVNVSNNGINAYQQFSSPNISIVSQPKGIDKVTYETKITGKHTVVSENVDIPICDNSLELIPCSIYDQEGKESQFYTRENILSDHALLIPLIEKQVQFSKSFLKAKMQSCCSHNIEIGDVMKFDNTSFLDMAGKEFLVIKITKRDYSEATMQIEAIEIIESVAVDVLTYDIFIYNQGVKESIRRDIPYNPNGANYNSDVSPWIWIDIF